jgi:hypothetical protein
MRKECRGILSTRCFKRGGTNLFLLVLQEGRAAPAAEGEEKWNLFFRLESSQQHMASKVRLRYSLQQTMQDVSSASKR